jgi:sugar lactone lactonase YvrE
MKIRETLLFIFVMSVLYLFFWPVPVDPVVWEPPYSPAIEGVYAPNNTLGQAEILGAGDGVGPEDVEVNAEGNIYAGFEEGVIMRYKHDGSGGELFAHTGGRPLGLEFDANGNLIVADALKGLLSIDPKGQITVLTSGTSRVKFGFADDVDVADDGTIYFSDASSKTGITDYRHDIVEHRPYGGLYAYDPEDERTYLVEDRMFFANGVAVSPDGSFVLVNETSEYRVRKVWVKGSKQGRSKILLDGLPDSQTASLLTVKGFIGLHYHPGARLS